MTPSLSIPPSPQGGPPLRRALESRQGLTSYAVTSIDDLDVPALTTLVDEAWRTDHSHQARLMWDEAFLRWLLTEPPWVGVLLCTPAGLLVGFELALERTLYGRQQEFRAYYASALAVSSSHRRRGLGRWLLEDLHHLVFEERRADLIYSSFLDGRAGVPTVEDTYARLPDWGVQRFHTSPIFARPAPGLVGQIQTVHASRCPPLLLQEALRHLCRFFRDQGAMPPPSSSREWCRRLCSTTCISGRPETR